MFKITQDDIKPAIKYLKRDIQDDWYCDPQNFEDILSNPTKLEESINERIKSGNGIYLPAGREIYNIPKGNGCFRYTIEMSPIDRVAYHTFGVYLIDRLDCALPYNILSHRRSKNDPEKIYKPMIEQWQKFVNYTRVCGKNKFILETDLSNYYEYIDIDILKAELIRATGDSGLTSNEYIRCHYFVESIIAILRSISFNGKRGIPQNRDISSFLGNIYMRILDKDLSGVEYFRYMDDIRVITSTRSESNNCMKRITNTLRSIGLSVNGSKTKVLIPGTPDHESFIKGNDLRAERLGALLRSGKRNYVLEAFEGFFDKVVELLDSRSINERSFRYNANRLITYCHAKDVTVPKKNYKILGEKLAKALSHQPDCADQIASLYIAIGNNKKLTNEIADWCIDPENQSFDWAIYTLIKAILISKEKSSKLSEYCKKSLADDKSPEPIRSIAAIYIASNVPRAKSILLDAFSLKNSILFQRHLLVATSKISSKEIHDKGKSKYILKELKGLHPRLHESSKSKSFQYIHISKPLTHDQLIQDMKIYA